MRIEPGGHPPVARMLCAIREAQSETCGHGMDAAPCARGFPWCLHHPGTGAHRSRQPLPQTAARPPKTTPSSLDINQYAAWMSLFFTTSGIVKSIARRHENAGKILNFKCYLCGAAITWKIEAPFQS